MFPPVDFSTWKLSSVLWLDTLNWVGGVSCSISRLQVRNHWFLNFLNLCSFPSAIILKPLCQLFLRFQVNTELHILCLSGSSLSSPSVHSRQNSFAPVNYGLPRALLCSAASDFLTGVEVFPCRDKVGCKQSVLNVGNCLMSGARSVSFCSDAQTTLLTRVSVAAV